MTCTPSPLLRALLTRTFLPRTLLALAAGGFLLLAGEQVPPVKSGGWTSAAEARVGRPLTPMSYAGVARRTTRRAAAVGAGAAAYGAYGAYGASGCVQVADAYGRLYTQCP